MFRLLLIILLWNKLILDKNKQIVILEVVEMVRPSAGGLWEGGCCHKINLNLKKIRFYLKFDGFQMILIYKFGMCLFMKFSPIVLDVQIYVSSCFIDFMTKIKMKNYGCHSCLNRENCLILATAFLHLSIRLAIWNFTCLLNNLLSTYFLPVLVNLSKVPPSHGCFKNSTKKFLKSWLINLEP